MQRVFPSLYHLHLSTPLPKNSFTVNDQPYGVPCAFQIWIRKDFPRTIPAIITPRYFEYTLAPHRDPAAKYDLAVRRVGYSAGTAYLPSLVTHNRNHYLINLLLPPQYNNPTTIIRLLHDHINQNQHLFQKENTTGPRSISQQEFSAIINPFLATAVSE
jgi:hypothetical protein